MEDKEHECLFCGEPELCEIHEAWADHTFMIETCCSQLHDVVTEELSGEASRNRGTGASPWVRKLIERALPWRARGVAEYEGQILVDFVPSIESVSLADAKAFITKHHEHCGAPVGWKFGCKVTSGPTLLGVATVGRPVAHKLDARGDMLEVNRLCLDRNLPAPLRAHASSMVYAWCARETEKRGYGHIISYIRDDETGVSLRAAGWIPEQTSAGGSWARSGRIRESTNTVPKVRWGRSLRPSARARQRLEQERIDRKALRERRRHHAIQKSAVKQATI